MPGHKIRRVDCMYTRRSLAVQHRRGCTDSRNSTSSQEEGTWYRQSQLHQQSSTVEVVQTVTTVLAIWQRVGVTDSYNCTSNLAQERLYRQ